MSQQQIILATRNDWAPLDAAGANVWIAWFDERDGNRELYTTNGVAVTVEWAAAFTDVQAGR